MESAQPRNDFRPSLASVDDLVQFGSEHLRLVQSTEEVAATGKLAKTLRCPQGTHWLRISSLRIDGDKESPPVGWTDVYIDPAYTEVAEAAREQPDTLISSLIEARYGRAIAEIQQDVQAVIVSEEMAKRLAVKPGTQPSKSFAGIWMRRAPRSRCRSASIPPSDFPCRCASSVPESPTRQDHREDVACGAGVAFTNSMTALFACAPVFRSESMVGPCGTIQWATVVQCARTNDELTFRLHGLRLV